MKATANHGDRGSVWLRWITRGSLVLGLIALAITVYAVGVDALAAHLRAIGPWFVVLLAIEATGAMCEAGAMYLMTRGKGAPTWRKVYVAQFAGRAVNTVTPGGNLGEALKVSLLARGCSPQRVVAAVMFVALTAITISLAVVAGGTLVTALAFEVPHAAKLALVGAGVVAGVVASGLVVLMRRGMLCAFARGACRMRLISKKRLDTWTESLADVDARLRGDVPAGSDHRMGAAALVLLAQILQRVATCVAIFAAGYSIGAPQLIAVLSAGVVLNWASSVVPMGVGVSEGGNYALFALIGAPASLGLALALARRVNQIVFAALGFGVLAADRIATGVDDRLPVALSAMATSTARHAVVR